MRKDKTKFFYTSIPSFKVIVLFYRPYIPYRMESSRSPVVVALLVNVMLKERVGILLEQAEKTSTTSREIYAPTFDLRLVDYRLRKETDFARNNDGKFLKICLRRGKISC